MTDRQRPTATDHLIESVDAAAGHFLRTRDSSVATAVWRWGELTICVIQIHLAMHIVICLGPNFGHCFCYNYDSQTSGSPSMQLLVWGYGNIRLRPKCPMNPLTKIYFLFLVDWIRLRLFIGKESDDWEA